MTEPLSTPPAPSSGDLVAPPSLEYRLRRLAVALILLGAGLWCVYDGFILWPAENARAQADKQMIPHGGLSIPMNQGLALILPFAGIFLAFWTLRTSRGCYRLSGDTLSIPGHPPIPLHAIRKIDKRLWDRKGIAYVHYETPDGTRSRAFRLDDFAYQRMPTDQILDRLEAYALATGREQ